MTLSHLLIAHSLDPVVGRRISTLLHADASPVSENIAGLIALAKARNARRVEDFFPQATSAQQRLALQIISGLYLGVIDDQPGAEVFEFELALMFQPTLDVSTIPTYAISGPNGWSSKAPPITAMPVF